MKIEIFNHEILGEMHVFGDENGLWFSLYDIADCLIITQNRATIKFKHLPKDLKQIHCCVMEKYSSIPQEHRFVHEKVVYELMCIGESHYCDEFRKWVADIAVEFDILNIHCCDSQLGCWGDAQTNYNVVKEYIEKINDISPMGEAAKGAMRDLDSAFRDKLKSDNLKPIIKEKSYRTDYTIDEACNNPDFHPAKNDDSESLSYYSENNIEERLRDIHTSIEINDFEKIVFNTYEFTLTDEYKNTLYGLPYINKDIEEAVYKIREYMYEGEIDYIIGESKEGDKIIELYKENDVWNTWIQEK